jgi:hypothetical protein
MTQPTVTSSRSMSAHAMFAGVGSVNIALSVLDCLLFMQSLRSCLQQSQSLSEKGFFGRRARVAQLDGSGRTFAFQ